MRTVLLLLASAVAPLAAKTPNIVLIMADDVGRDAIGCYGGESYATPNIDKLASEGMRFTGAYSMAVCHPTRVTLMTGKYPTVLGNPAWGSFPKREEAASIGNVMKRAGYRTAVAGKWQLSLMKNDKRQPARMGFDEWCLFGWHEGPRFNDPMIYQNGALRGDTEGKFGPDLYTAFLIDFMKRAGDEPFFAYFPMALCHDVTDDIGRPVPFYKDGRWMSFAEMVEAMDDKIGELVAAVDELGIADDTLILFTTDNGSPNASYLTVRDAKMVKDKVVSRWRGRDVRGGKGKLNDWGTRVPLLARWKGTIEPGGVVGDLIDMSDYLPTLAELGGGEPAPGLNGQSFAARLLGTGEGPRTWAYAEHKGRRFVSNGRYKYYGGRDLFDLDEDPAERRPLRGRHELKAELSAALRSITGDDPADPTR